MKVLIVGSGGREHAMAWKVAQSPQVEAIYVAPGNAGTALEHKTANIPIGAHDIPALVGFARQRKVELTIVGPEAPLVAGIVDTFTDADLRCFGPTRGAARLEGSKNFCKAFLRRHNIPTAAYESFTDLGVADAYIRAQGAPIVVKADGLAAGKGVTVASSVEQGIDAARRMLLGEAFGAAGRQVVIEDYLQGEEVSFIAVVDGEHIVPLASAQDHKPRDEGDQGPNTGGMGAYSPAPLVTEELRQRILREIIEPTVHGLASEGHPYTGFLYAGLIVGADGIARVLEFNCRSGDPETQPILMRLKSDFTVLCEAALEGQLDQVVCDWDERVALGVVLAATGYPGAYPKGEAITGLDTVVPGTQVFHAGTRLENGRVVTAGGRVLCVCGMGETVARAQALAYERARGVHWDNMYYRRDIGYRAVDRALTPPIIS